LVWRNVPLKKLVSRALHRDDLPLDEQAYRRLAASGYAPASIIDIGAHDGNWTRLARRIFPNASIMMIEPLSSKAESLSALAKSLKRTRFVDALLGAEAGRTITFYEAGTGSSVHREQSNVEFKETSLQTSRLDDVAEQLDGPIFLKLDVQGAELEVLDGGPKTLDRSDLVQLEVALLPYNDGAATFLEVIEYLDQRGFVPFDIAGMIRPTGAELVQVDMLFVPAGSPLRPKHFVFQE
jgi:FkbM family methyltransferase